MGEKELPEVVNGLPRLLQKLILPFHTSYIVPIIDCFITRLPTPRSLPIDSIDQFPPPKRLHLFHEHHHVFPRHARRCPPRAWHFRPRPQGCPGPWLPDLYHSCFGSEGVIPYVTPRMPCTPCHHSISSRRHNVGASLADFPKKKTPSRRSTSRTRSTSSVRARATGSPSWRPTARRPSRRTATARRARQSWRRRQSRRPRRRARPARAPRTTCKGTHGRGCTNMRMQG